MSNFLDPMGPVAAAQQHHLLVVLALTMIAVLPVLIGVPLIYWRYRRGRGAAYRPDWHFSRTLEIAMWGVPLAIVAVLGVLLWQDSHRYAPERPLGPAPVRIEAVALNWKWLFIYPDGHAASLGELVLPVGQPVQLVMTSDSVMQSFMVPALAGQLYAMPGMVTRLNVEASRTGETKGRNMQYSGNGFAQEEFAVRILPAPKYRAWLASAGKNALALDTKSYAAIAAPGSLQQARAALGQKGDGPLVFSLAEPQLFDRILARYTGGRAIAPAQQPGAPAYRAEAAR